MTATPDGTTVSPCAPRSKLSPSGRSPEPQTQMRSFLGWRTLSAISLTVSAVSRHPSSTCCQGLEKKRTAPLRWNDRADEIFDQLRAAITNSAVLSVADDSKPFVVHTDASDYAVGAVLSQRNERGELRPIGFVSEKLSDVEYRWSVYRRNCTRSSSH